MATLVGPSVRARYNGRFRPARIVLGAEGRPVVVDGHVRVYMTNHGGMRLVAQADILNGWRAVETGGIVVIAGGKGQVIAELNRIHKAKYPQSSTRMANGSYDVRYKPNYEIYIVEPLA